MAGMRQPTALDVEWIVRIGIHLIMDRIHGGLALRTAEVRHRSSLFGSSRGKNWALLGSPQE
jgi:hypothetical protein